MERTTGAVQEETVEAAGDLPGKLGVKARRLLEVDDDEAYVDVPLVGGDDLLGQGEVGESERCEGRGVGTPVPPTVHEAGVDAWRQDRTGLKKNKKKIEHILCQLLGPVEEGFRRGRGFFLVNN